MGSSHMGKLTKKERDNLPDSQFALPGRRFPIHDADHCRAALSGASRALKKHHITKAEYDIVIKKAKARLETLDHTGQESFTHHAGTFSRWASCAGYEM